MIPKIFYFMGEKCHLINTLNDGDVWLVVYKKWRKHKSRWDYCCERQDIILSMMDKKS